MSNLPPRDEVGPPILSSFGQTYLNHVGLSSKMSDLDGTILFGKTQPLMVYGNFASMRKNLQFLRNNFVCLPRENVDSGRTKSADKKLHIQRRFIYKCKNETTIIELTIVNDFNQTDF